MSIQWRDQMSVGVKVIDEDHKVLIGLVNLFETEMRANLDLAGLNTIAKRLYDYAKTHFDREEKIQLVSDYPTYDAHRRLHASLLADLEAFIRKVFIDRKVTVGPETADELSNFLQHWLVDHVLQVDLKMKGHLKEK